MEVDIRYRPGTQDQAVWRDVFVKNEYRLPDRFADSDVIIDIGAHIGIFSLACLARGAGALLAYEPDEANFNLLKTNLEEFPGAKAHHLAVHRSDVAPTKLAFSSYKPGCTATGVVFPAESEVGVDTIGLDAIIGDKEIRLLKLDCEFSEYPILYTTTKLSQVREMVGELHTLGEGYRGTDWDCTPLAVEKLLRKHGFMVEMWRAKSTDARSRNCLFSAKR